MAIKSQQQKAYKAFMNLDTQRQRAMTIGTQATPFGCCNFFEECTDQLMSLHYSGTLPLLDWMGFDVTDECYQVMEYITYVRPEFTDDVATVGYISDPCATPNGYEFGTAKITVEDFGLYGRLGPVRSILKPERWCATSPARRLDGTLVEDEREWDIRFGTDVMLQDISRDLILGNSTTPGQFDGLERWVRTGYAGPNGQALDSYVVNWNGNPMSGGAGITVNGVAIASTYNIIDVFESLLRKIMERIKWSRQLANQQLMLGDIILLMPSGLAECFINFFSCWSVCEGTQYNEVQKNSKDVRDYRRELLAQGSPNLFGAGYISLWGTTIPILTYDWGLIKGPKTGDIYLLTGSVGSVRLWEGQHLNADVAAARFDEAGFFSIDGGRILGKVDSENLCETMKVWMSLRLFNRAPWAQIRVQNVQCDTPAGFLSPDPLETSFYIQSSFTPANC